MALVHQGARPEPPGHARRHGLHVARRARRVARRLPPARRSTTATATSTPRPPTASPRASGCRPTSTTACSWRATSRTSRSCSASSAFTPGRGRRLPRAAARRLVRVSSSSAPSSTAPAARWRGSTSRGSASRATSASTSTAPTPTTCARRCASSPPSPPRRRCRSNPLLGDARGDALLYDPYVDRAALAVSAPRRRRPIEIPPSAFAAARWERLGTWGVGASAHAYGGGDGWFEYSFVLARRRDADAGGASVVGVAGQQRAARWRLAMSSVFVDGARVATLGVIPDDGNGRLERIRLGKLRRRTPHPAAGSRAGCERAWAVRLRRRARAAAHRPGRQCAAPGRAGAAAGGARSALKGCRSRSYIPATKSQRLPSFSSSRRLSFILRSQRSPISVAIW